MAYKIKIDEYGTLQLRARICPHGNCEELKDEVRKESATAQYNVIRLLLAISTYLPMRVGLVDISGSYIQSGPIRREAFARPPREWDRTTRGPIWELLKFPYGITEAERQWALVLESFLTHDMGMETIETVSQFFIK